MVGCNRILRSTILSSHLCSLLFNTVYHYFTATYHDFTTIWLLFSQYFTILFMLLRPKKASATKNVQILIISFQFVGVSLDFSPCHRCHCHRSHSCGYSHGLMLFHVTITMFWSRSGRHNSGLNLRHCILIPSSRTGTPHSELITTHQGKKGYPRTRVFRELEKFLIVRTFERSFRRTYRR